MRGALGRVGKRVQAAWYVCLFATLLVFSAPPEGRPQQQKVVSYLTAFDWVEGEPGDCGPAGCEWRVYDPRTGRDELLWKLPALPANVFWDESFDWVHYRVGNQVFRAAWKAGARPEPVLSVPGHLAANPWSISHLWIDEQAGRWGLLAWEQANEIDYASLWRYSQEESTWQLLKKEETRCGCGDCLCASVLKAFIHDEGYVFLKDLLDSMRIGHHLERLGRAVNGGEEEPVSIPSGTVANARLKVTVAMGDSLHAMAPLVYMQGERGDERTVYETTQPCYAFPQLGFAEEGAFLLVGTEYETRCGRLIDMKTGNLVRALPLDSTLAVWVTPPRN